VNSTKWQSNGCEWKGGDGLSENGKEVKGQKMKEMQSIKGTILIVMLICGVIVCPCLGKAGHSVSGKRHPTASELLDKLTQTQDKLQSFIIKGKTSTEYSMSVPLFSPEHIRANNEKYYQLWEVRTDGNRATSRVHTWGTPDVTVGCIPENNPSYMSHTWDGQKYWNYTRHYDDSGISVINMERNEWENKALLGAQGSGLVKSIYPASQEPANIVLREARSISVQDKAETINGVECYVIDADTRCGKYKVWIDPEHGYNIAKAQVQLRKGENYSFLGRPFETAGDKLSYNLENVRFEKFDDVWVPVEADIRSHRVLRADRGSFGKAKTHIKITGVTLNPDHDALGSFLPDDIRDGAMVGIVEIPKITYTWQDGKVVDEKGREVDYKAKAKENKE
jgi:hypothetical protein